MYGLTRGTMTLLGAAAAGVLLWIASQVDAESLGGFWLFVGILAAAGLCIPLSQLLGGWTKWGWPRASLNVLLLGFLPALIVGGLVLLHAQPEDAMGSSWAGDIGVDGLAEDLTALLPAIAFALGAFFGLIFDTTGPRVARDEELAVERRGYAGPVPADTRRPADEPLTAERHEVVDRPVAERPAETTPERERELVGTASDGDTGERGRSRRFFRRG
jgi:hypothetical protein